MDGVPISPSFKDRIGETQVDQVLDRFFPERMIDAEGGLVWEIGAEYAVERLRQGEFRPEGFSTTTQAPALQPGHQHFNDEWLANGTVA